MLEIILILWDNFLMQITGKTKIVGVMGWPVKHTFSPIMHNACFSQLNMNWVYLPFNVEPERLKEAIYGLSALGIVGVNVTIPHKIEAMSHLTGIDEKAKMIGAVNTIKFGMRNAECGMRENGIFGYNTDGEGFIASIKDFSLKGKNALLIGCGGAGRAIGVSLAYEGIARLCISDVSKEREDGLYRLLKDNFNCFVKSFDGKVEPYDLIINASPLGMKENDPIPIELSLIQKEQIVYDIIYNPPKTRLLIEGEKRGAKIINGIEMLIHQGARAFEIWTGVYPPIDVMRRAVLEKLR
ncbi:MAG: shikimate dehydrogenase [bacterium]